MNYWLLKTEPEVYSWDTLVKEKEGTWDGVRNHQARLNILKMKKGDRAFIYHTGNEKAVVGVALVTSAPFPERNAEEWISVRIKPDQKLGNPVNLTTIKSEKKLSNISLVKNSRLSVHEFSAEAFDHILKLSKS